MWLRKQGMRQLHLVLECPINWAAETIDWGVLGNNFYSLPRVGAIQDLALQNK